MALDNESRELFILVFEHLKEQRNALAGVLAEVAAVRDALIAIGPKYDEIVTRHRAHHAKESKQLAFADFRKFDEIIQRLRESV